MWSGRWTAASTPHALKRRRCTWPTFRIFAPATSSRRWPPGRLPAGKRWPGTWCGILPARVRRCLSNATTGGNLNHVAVNQKQTTDCLLLDPRPGYGPEPGDRKGCRQPDSIESGGETVAGQKPADHDRQTRKSVTPFLSDFVS